MATLLMWLCTLAGAPAEPQPKFQAAAQMVMVPVTVVNRSGAVVPGLSRAMFSVAQDKVPQQIASFGEQDLPVSAGIVFDTSGSMSKMFPQALAALHTFFDTCNPEDEAFVYEVSSRPRTISGFTSDFGTLLSHVSNSGADGSTALVDTIYAAVRKARSGRNTRTAVLIVSDGMDNHSRYSKTELIAAAAEADVQLYSVAMFEPSPNRKAIELREEKEGLSFLDELSRRTGGLSVVARSNRDVQKAAVTIGLAMRNQYLIGYVPRSAANAGLWHSIQVKLNIPGTTVYARSGFVVR